MAVRNWYKVPKKQWRKWTAEGKRAFNYIFGLMNHPFNQDLFRHPKTPALPRDQWRTTAWNAAWMAADFASRKDD